MKKFNCGNCGSEIFFDNTRCLTCKKQIAFSTKQLSMIALETDASGVRHEFGDESEQVVLCSNASHGVCNWLVHSRGDQLCRACSLNRTIPNLSVPGNLEAWRALEGAKHRLVYSLLVLELPMSGEQYGTAPLTFDFVDDAKTGHIDGVITIDVDEADAVERHRQRQQLDERYRTLLGHMRHEVGHYYWMVLVDGGQRHAEFRRLFGDDRADYQGALSAHYQNGPKPNWRSEYVSAYASSHPWEDWAETWAHYLHMLSVLDTADDHGFEPRSSGFDLGAIWPFRREDVYRTASFKNLFERWVAMTLALNSINRSMGHDDFYPFVIPELAKWKLEFVHRLVHENMERRRKSVSKRKTKAS